MIIKQTTLLDDIWKEHNHFYDDGFEDMDKVNKL